MAANPDDRIASLPGWKLREMMVGRQVRPIEVVDLFLDRIHQLDPSLHSFITVEPELVRTQALQLEDRLASGAPAGPLFGVPISIKDNLWTKDLRTTAGSLIYEHHLPSEDSIHVHRLRQADAIIMGKTNLPEFALFPRTRNRLQPECLNPWDLNRSPGGSSGGAAASVAALLTAAAIGTDGGGSIRIPAALCGVFGLHPSLGRLPHHGSVGSTLMFSSPGPITRDVRDAAVMLQVLARPDPSDPMGRGDEPPDYLENLEAGVAGMKLLWVRDCGRVEGLNARVVDLVAEAATRFRELGATLVESDRGLSIERWIDAFYTIMHADRYASLGQGLYENPACRGMLSDYARDHFQRARPISGAEYSRALETRFKVVAFFEELIRDHDLILCPTVAGVAPSTASPITREPLVAYTFLVNFVGYTAATVPCGLVDGLPMGLQVIGRANCEGQVLRACRALERALPFASAIPAMARLETKSA